jgi:hypothetical protein
MTLFMLPAQYLHFLNSRDLKTINSLQRALQKANVPTGIRNLKDKLYVYTYIIAKSPQRLLSQNAQLGLGLGTFYSQ